MKRRQSGLHSAARGERLRVALAATCVLVAASACQSWRAAGLYREGTAQLRAGDAPAAVVSLEEARTLAPEISAIHNHLGLAYASADRRSDALLSFERAVELDCDNRAASRNLANVRQGRWDELTSVPADLEASP